MPRGKLPCLQIGDRLIPDSAIIIEALEVCIEGAMASRAPTIAYCVISPELCGR
jgi:glutathione S-transferase